MPEKLNNAGEMQQYDAETGRYGFKSFHKPRNYDAEIQALEEKSKGLSIFSPERRKITEQIQQLEAEKNGFKTYDELKEFRHNKVVEKSNKIGGNVNTPEKYIKDEHKEKQLEIINKFNPMLDDYHTGIRSVKDIKSPQEAFVNNDENYAYPDFTVEDGKKALQTGKIMVYSSKPISQGGFISPSKMMAQDYAGRSGKVYSQIVDINDVAWINSDEGQYAKV